jgi:hypothetical protein
MGVRESKRNEDGAGSDEFPLVEQEKNTKNI